MENEGINIMDCKKAVVLSSGGLDSTKAGVEGTLKIKIRTPLIQLTKAEIIRKGAELGVDYGLTISCYDPSQEGGACGHCDSCLLRKKGFQEAGVPDPTRYA